MRHFRHYVLLCALSIASTLSGAPILVYNTGVDNSNSLLADGAVDAHYTLVTSADSAFPGPNAIVVNSSGFPIPPWVSNGPDSKWIAPQGNQSTGNAAGRYIYQLTFSLAGLNPLTAVLSGQWAVDNTGFLRLNGVDVTAGSSGAVTGNGFGAFTAFTLNSANAAFNSGLNTLQFIVDNEGATASVNPTGLRVEIEGFADDLPGAAIPEPATYSLLGGVLLGLALTGKRKG